MMGGLHRAAPLLALAAIALFAGQGGAATINNGYFEGGFEPVGDDLCPLQWTMLQTMNSLEEISIIGSAEDNGPSAPGTFSASWTRSQGGNTVDWTAIEQTFDPPIDVQTQSHVGLSMDVKVISHDLGGAGFGPDRSEYPVTVVLFFTDINGIERYWQHGFFIMSTEETEPPPRGQIVAGGTGIVFSTLVPQDRWVSRFFDLTNDLQRLAVPKLITSIRIGGSGWNFQGQVDNVGFFARPLPVENTSWSSIKSLYH
jgi:hypothetical protein